MGENLNGTIQLLYLIFSFLSSSPPSSLEKKKKKKKESIFDVCFVLLKRVTVNQVQSVCLDWTRPLMTGCSGYRNMLFFDFQLSTDIYKKRDQVSAHELDLYFIILKTPTTHRGPMDSSVPPTFGCQCHDSKTAAANGRCPMPVCSRNEPLRTDSLAAAISVCNLKEQKSKL